MLLHDFVLIAGEVGVGGVVVLEVLKLIVQFLPWKEDGLASVEVLSFLDDDFIDFGADLIPHIPVFAIDCELMDFDLFVSV